MIGVALVAVVLGAGYSRYRHQSLVIVPIGVGAAGGLRLGLLAALLFSLFDSKQVFLNVLVGCGVSALSGALTAYFSTR